MSSPFAAALTGDLTMARTVLLVCADREQLMAREKAVGPLADKVYVASTFPQAKNILMEAKPDVLVTDLRLHEFNGIHLALWSRVRLPHLRSVIIGRTDPSLADDARAFGFDYVQEEGAAAIIDHTLRALDTELPQRRWPRKRLPFPVTAEVGGAYAALLDVSHGGVRIQMAEGTPEPDTTFRLNVAEFGVQATATCVWVKTLPGTTRWCGASITDAQMAGSLPWRTFVDTLHSETACAPGNTPP
jgi:CheY-like chemotaxis protein